MRLGIIARADDSGLGAQTRRLTYMLKPHRLLVIDSTSFREGSRQHFDWYNGFTGYRVKGFPSNHQVDVFLNDVTHVLVCETPYNYHVYARAKQRGIKTFCQANFEFLDHLRYPSIPKPDTFLMPTTWHLDEMATRFDSVELLRPPIEPTEFTNARTTNFARTGRRRILHVVGTLAHADRNGTLDLLGALEFAKEDFDLIIRSQFELPSEYQTNDRRVQYAIGNVKDAEELYTDFDLMVLPRRYGGLCLPMSEALMSGLPVVMPDISPNEVLPEGWRVPASVKTQFAARTMIDVYETDPRVLGRHLDEFVRLPQEILDGFKAQAFDIAHQLHAPSSIVERYMEVLNG